MSTSVVEALYYKLYNAILLGESQDAKMYLNFLRDEYEEDANSFIPLQNDSRFNHLKQLSNIVENNLIVKNTNYTANASDVQFASKDENQAETEPELIKHIFANPNNLTGLKKELRVSDSFCVYNIQQPTQFGKIDVMAMDNDTAFAIELKKSDARYSVISQIDKYVLDLKLKLCLKMYRNVVGVVIANGYIDQVVKELVKSDVIPIKYTLIGDQVRFWRLYGKETDCDYGSDTNSRQDEEKVAIANNSEDTAREQVHTENSEKATSKKIKRARKSRR